jgi:hypothetical protein
MPEWVWALRAHLLERLLELVQLVKAQGLQVNPAIVHACGCGADARAVRAQQKQLTTKASAVVGVRV